MRPFFLPAFFGKKFTQVYGGPYRERPADMFGVKMAAEIKQACDVDIPTRDFGTPNVTLLSRGLTDVLEHMVKKDGNVYVGCMGGIGRTGLFMAVLAKAFGQTKDPVTYTRRNYLASAVETGDQRKFVADFKITPYQKWLAFRLRVRNLFN